MLESLHGAAYVEMICTRELPKPGSRDLRECTNRLFAFAIPFVWIANPEKQKEGLNLIYLSLLEFPLLFLFVSFSRLYHFFIFFNPACPSASSQSK